LSNSNSTEVVNVEGAAATGGRRCDADMMALQIQFSAILKKHFAGFK
jgi:hypothetical protein